jgi:hypothetical protein
VARTFFALESEEAREEEVEEDLLGFIGDVHLNKYLVYGILETVLVKLCPEMKGKTPSELLADRGITVSSDGHEVAGTGP